MDASRPSRARAGSITTTRRPGGLPSTTPVASRGASSRGCGSSTTATAAVRVRCVRTAHSAEGEGALPLWTRYAAFGAPLAADIQTAPAEPYYFPLFLHPSQRVLNLVALMRLLGGGGGVLP